MWASDRRRPFVGPSARPQTTSVMLGVGVAVAVFFVAYRSASFDLVARSETGVLAAWLLLCTAILGLRRLRRAPTAVAVVGGGLLGLTAWTALSGIWAADRDTVFWITGLIALYTSVYLLAATGVPPRAVSAVCDGLAAAVGAVAVVAVVSRLFPSVFPSAASQLVLLPGSASRLSFPIGYWNGLGSFVATGLPLALRPAVLERSRFPVRLLAVAYLPVAGAVFYLSSSRGATLAGLLACVLFVLLAGDRWGAALAAVACGGIAAAAAAIWLRHETALIDHPRTALAHSQGRTSAFVIAVLALGAGAVYAAAWEGGLRAVRPGRAAAWTAIAAAVVVFVAGAVAVDVPRRFESFKASPKVTANESLESHFLSGGGTGRWQVWTSAWQEFRHSPWRGLGAGSFTTWWAQHGKIDLFLQNAHSLYLETLGELGIVGFVLLVLALGGGIVVGVTRTLGAAGDERTTRAAPAAALVVFAAGAAIDWVWQLPANGIVAMVVLGLASGTATAPPRPATARAEARRGMTRRTPLAVVVALAAVAGVILLLQLYQLVVQLRLDASRSAAARGDGVGALRDAESARSLASWLAEPHLQVALVQERFGSLRAAEAAVEDALVRVRGDWQIWATAARIQTERGEVARAARSLRQARRLNPRSPLLRP